MNGPVHAITLAELEETLPGAHPVLLMIADVSGYTRFMVANRMTLEHSQFLINQLLETILGELDLPLQVSKVEGDALFLYAIRDPDDHRWAPLADRLRRGIVRLFEVFRRRLDELARTVTCGCSACSNVDRLRLKVVIHAGEAYYCRIGRFDEWMGVDVILVHRLLKNSVAGDEYLLLTSEAVDALRLRNRLPFTRGVEEYDALGTVETFHCSPAALAELGSRVGDPRPERWFAGVAAGLVALLRG